MGLRQLVLKKAWSYFLQHRFSHDDRRNLRLGGIVSLYGISFAVEKGLNAFGMPQTDMCWFIVYGAFALLSSYWWFEDVVLDLWEKNTTEDEELYQDEKTPASTLEEAR